MHGISLDQLENEPRFSEICDAFLEFVDGSELIIHNAPFDMGFLDAEIKRLESGRGELRDRCKVLDSLALARSLHPGQKNTLDALCKRYEIDNSHREIHGALLDARILADVYLAMTSGQVSLGLGEDLGGAGQTAIKRHHRTDRKLKVILANDCELAAHQARLKQIEATSGKYLWRD